jgi:hypothetical protein
VDTGGQSRFLHAARLYVISFTELATRDFQAIADSSLTQLVFNQSKEGAVIHAYRRGRAFQWIS